MFGISESTWEIFKTLKSTIGFNLISEALKVSISNDFFFKFYNH